MPLNSGGAKAEENQIWVEGNRLSHDIISMLMPHLHLPRPSEKCGAKV